MDSDTRASSTPGLIEQLLANPYPVPSSSEPTWWEARNPNAFTRRLGVELPPVQGPKPAPEQGPELPWYWRAPYRSFQRSEFLALATRHPLGAAQLLREAVRYGAISFPAGTDGVGSYNSLYLHIDMETECVGYLSFEDNWPLLQRYSPLWEGKPYSDPSDSPAFPLDFVFELLERVSNGEHPVFCTWVQQMLESLFPESDLAEGEYGPYVIYPNGVDQPEEPQ